MQTVSLIISTQAREPASGWMDPQASCRLLYVVGQLALGGLERQLYYLLASLDRDRYQPALVAWNSNPNEKYHRDISALKVQIYGFPAGWSPLAKLRAFRSLAGHIAPEIIHSYGFHTNFAAYYASWGTKAVPIGSLRSDFATIKKVGGSFRGALNARWPAFHISNSLTCVEGARRDHSFFTPRHFSVVRNGLDLNGFRSTDDIPKSKPYIASVGSLLPVKRWDRVLRLAHKLKHAGFLDVRFRIAGDGPLRSSLEQLARDLDVANNVAFIGATHDVPSFLAGAKFLVHTSESEGCPNVVMEAMACGLPVVAMNAGDIRFLVNDGHTGFVVPQKDEATLIDRTTILLQDQGLTNRMGQASRKKAELEYGLDRLVNETLDAYRAAGWNDARCA